MTTLTWLAYCLSALGAINCSSVVFFNLNMFDYLLNMIGARYVYTFTYAAIGIAGLYSLLQLLWSFNVYTSL